MAYEQYISLRNNNIVQSTNDERKYSGLTLSNGLKVLLISDPSTEKAAASLDVNVGGMSDPKSLPGLAHFLEHMLFLGTEKFPDEDDYRKFITQNGGCCNAYTSSLHTNYYFEISNSHLNGALDRFVEFFLTPSFTQSCTERELNNVHSEHQKNLSLDSRRVLGIERGTLDEEHDYSRFHTGNLDTLKFIPESQGIDVRSALLDFHSKWYSANIMSLAVLGKESLEELTEMVVTRFWKIENKNVTVPKWTNSPLGEKQLRKIIYVVPIKDIRILKIFFPFPDLREHYKSQPGHYLSHIVGHEGRGSLLSYLKKENLCTTLESGYSSYAGFGFFHIKVDLTENGISQPNSVLEAIFEYLNMLKDQLPQQVIFDELKQLSNIKFRFMEKEHPRLAVLRTSSTLQDYPVEEVLSANLLLHEFKPELIMDLLHLLNADNCRVLLIGKMFEKKADQREKWYDAEYGVEDMDNDLLQRLKSVKVNDNFHLPLPNEFIPTSLELVKRENISLFPKLMRNSETSRLWFHQDSQFLVPKAFVGITFTSPFVSVDPLYSLAVSLFTSLLRDSLNEYTYDAELAGLSYTFDYNMFGFYLWVFGFNENMKKLVSKVVNKICDFDFEMTRFDVLKEQSYRKLRSFHSSDLIALLKYHTTMVLSHKHWSVEDLLETEEQLTFEKLKEIMNIVLSKLHIEVFADGNLTSEDAVSLLEEVDSKCRTKYRSKRFNSNSLRNREYQLPDNSVCVYEVSNNVQHDNAVDVYFQTGADEVNEKVKLELLGQILNSHCFHNLRTVEQLGYIVHLGVRCRHGVQGLRIVIQSQRHPEYLEARIENFIAWAKDYLSNLPADEFELNKQGILINKADKPKQLLHNSLEMFAEISEKKYLFDRRNIEIDAIAKLTKDDIVNFFNQHIDVNAKRKRLNVRIVSEKAMHADDIVKNGNSLYDESRTRAIKITDISRFQNSLGLHPLPRPHIDLTVVSSGCKNNAT